MPRDAQAQYSLPPIYLATTGQTVLAEQHNVPLQDIAQALTNSLPRNGTGGMLANLPMSNYRITQLGNAQQPGDAVSLGQAASIGVPVGTILDYAGATAPTGYLLCFGQSVLRADYPDLFAVIGTAYGNVDSSTFNLPDCRGRVVAGRNNMGGTSADRLTSTTMSPNGNTLGASGGAQTHALTEAQNGPHNHGGSTTGGGVHTHPYSDNTVGGAGPFTLQFGGDFARNPVSRTTSNSPPHEHNIPNSGSGSPHNNVQPTMIANKIIKAFNA